MATIYVNRKGRERKKNIQGRSTLVEREAEGPDFPHGRVRTARR